MSWKDRLRPASFRGVPFQVEGDGLSVGRRTQVHEYPQRDKPFVEDLGRAPRRITLTAFLIGPDYMDARDALLAALEEAGPGTLVHPWYGQMTVAVDGDCRAEHSRDEGGMCRISLSFMEAGDLAFPAAKVDTRSTVRSAGAEVKAASLDQFAQDFTVQAVPDWVIDQAAADLAEVKAFAADSLGVDVGTLDATVEAGAAIWSAVEGASAAVPTLLRVAGYQSGAASVIGSTPSRLIQAANRQAVQDVVRHAALVSSATAAAARSWPVYDDAVAARDGIAAALDAAASATSSDRVFRSLYDLRIAVVKDINARAVNAARLREEVPLSSQPLEVVAYDLYEDAERANEIATRNSVRNPSWADPGEPLKVLNR